MNYKIEKLKEKLELIINMQNCCLEDICRLSCLIDEQSVKICPKNLKIELLLKKYFIWEYRENIIEKIKEDFINNNIKISNNDLNILAEYIYEFCCLRKNKVSDTVIKDFILYKNNSYYNKLKDEVKNTEFYDLKILTYLVEKYTKIINEYK